MPTIDTELVLTKIVEVHQKLRYVTTVEETVRILLPALAEAVGFSGVMLKVREDDGLFRGYVLDIDGSIGESTRSTELGGYVHYMKRAQRVSNSYFASHEIDVWADAGLDASWENTYDDPNWKPGSWHPEDSLLVPVFDQNDELSGVLWPDKPIDGQIPDEKVVQIIEVFATQAVGAIEIRRLLERTKQAAITDGLTRLHTHRYFQECLDYEIAEAGRHDDRVSLLMLDIDHFKQVNDEFGHPIGDRVLRETAEVLRSASREMDHVARYGGEEFAIVLPRCDTAGAISQAERIREALKDDSRMESVKVTVSIGVATYPSDATDKSALIATADAALLHAKRTGRDRVCHRAARRKIVNE